MLDAYIIERIQRRREQPDGVQIPLRIHDAPPPPPPRDERKQEDEPDRGSVIIDFHF